MNEIEQSQIRLYLGKYQKFGDDPRSLSWNDSQSQYLRFKNISELFKHEGTNPFTVHEVGCGLGHFKKFLESEQITCTYSGSDIIKEFIDANRRKFPDCSFYIENISKNIEEINPEIVGFDYYFLNGTFYTKERNSIEDWEKFIFKSTDNMFQMAKKGICINFLTIYSDYYDDNLYYADPKKIIDWCIRNFSRFISINHDIPLYEFFVFLYKENFMKEKFPGYSRYFRM
jgi:hypothetical protein